MTTAIAIEDVRREVKILRALTGHKNLVQFYDAFEDDENVYIVMELCQGGELLDKILQRGGKYSEVDAKKVMIQILSVVAYCHLQGVVHRDLKPEVNRSLTILFWFPARSLILNKSFSLFLFYFTYRIFSSPQRMSLPL
jgi:tRNA A-37 threonylcarbamoyl transferase component Bud32